MRFDSIVDRYDFLNHLLSVGQDFYWRRVMLRELRACEGDLVLDLATGTGDGARAIVEKGVSVTGVDISFNMIKRAKEKITGAPYSVLAGSAYAIPLKSLTFDSATCAFGIRNMHETSRALKEIYRVLKKGGTMVFLEFSMPRGIIRGPYRFYLNSILPLIAGLFSEREAYDYLADSIEKFYTPEEFATLIVNAGFTRCHRMPLSFGCVYIHIAYKD